MADLPVHRFPGRDGRQLAYREIGDGRPLVLLHGFMATGSQWIDHGPAAAIAEHGHRVILPDLRGHGAGPIDGAWAADPAAYPPDVLVDDGLALLDRLGLDDFDLGGYSLGARVALRMLVRGARPGSAIIGGQGSDAVNRTTSRTGRTRRLLLALANGDAIEPGSAEEQFARWITLSGSNPRALCHALDSLVATPHGALRAITTRTLVVVGDEDHDHASADALAAALPNARFARVPGNHVTALGTPEFTAAIVDFLSTATFSG